VIKLPYLHEIGAATGTRYSAFQPVLTRYKLLEIERRKLDRDDQHGAGGLRFESVGIESDLRLLWPGDDISPNNRRRTWGARRSGEGP
jgi:hypothetical protein